MDTKIAKTTKENLIADIEKRQEDGIIEKSNAELLIKLINNADDLNEAINIAALGTTYKRTGFHFDKRLEKLGSDIKFFKKNEKLSFAGANGTTVGASSASHITHKLIIGDNYDALQNLLIEYKGKIDVIYIDPPYGKDSMGEFAETNYDNAITRDNLLSMLYNRLVLARELLTDDGVIFCSIDDKNQAYVKCLFDEVFGERNYINNFMWLHGKGKKNKQSRTMQQYNICFAKNIDRTQEWNEKQYTDYKFTNPDNDPKGEWFSGSISFDEKRSNPKHENYYTIKSPSGVIWTRQWQVSEDEMDDLIKSGDIFFGYPPEYDNTPRLKIRPSQIDIIPSNIIDNVGTTKSAETSLYSVLGTNCFNYPKPVGLIKHFLSIINNKSVKVLDFFAGSGTTGQAVLELNKQDGGNRQFILCTNNEKTDTTPNGIAYDVTSKRLKRVMTGKCYDGTSDFEWIKKNDPLGGSLDVYEIESVSNHESAPSKTAFDVIDETLYGMPKFSDANEKIKWVCENFEHAQKYESR